MQSKKQRIEALRAKALELYSNGNIGLEKLLQYRKKIAQLKKGLKGE